MTEGVHYIRDKATLLVDMKASTPTLDYSSNICTSIALYQLNMYKQIHAKTVATFIARLEG